MAAIGTFAMSTSKMCLRSIYISQRHLLQKSPRRAHALKLFSTSANLKADLYYTISHEWIRVDGDLGTVGISKYAQGELGDVVYVELPEVGVHLNKGEEASVIESVKAASDIYSPVSGNVSDINTSLQEKPDLINKDPLEEGWIYKINLVKTEELEDLMKEASYDTYVGSQGH